jgi:hypothetical protein
MYGFGIGSTLDGSIVQYLKISEYLLQIGGIVPVPSGLSNKKRGFKRIISTFYIGFFLNWRAINCESQVSLSRDGLIGLLHL